MRQISEKTTVQVGLQVLEKLEALHEVGYLYNDLKPDNILVGNHDDHKLHKIRLTDFGISKKYLDDEGNHIKSGKTQFFTGNFLFASLNAFDFKILSRRDDLISLCYLLVYMIDGDLPFMTDAENNNPNRREEFNRVKDFKENLEPKELC